MARRGAAGRRPKFARPWAGARGQILSFGTGYIKFEFGRACTMAGRVASSASGRRFRGGKRH